MKRISIWILINSVFVAALYFGFYEGIEGSLNIAYFLAWVAILSSFCAYDEDTRKVAQELGRSVPASIGYLVDFAILGVFVWYGAIFTPIMYLIHIINLYHLYEEDK